MKKRSFLVMLVMGMMVTNVLMLGMWFAPHIGHINEPDIGERGVNDGLIAHYEFNNGTGTVLYDHGPNGFNGTLAGGIPDWSAGRWSRGLHFDGVSDYVDIGDVAKYIGKNGVQSVALTAWVNYTALDDLEIIGDDDLHIFAELQVESTNGTIHFWMENSTDADFRVWSNSALNDGKWHFIVGQYNYTTGKMQIWVDGVLNQERTYFFTPANTPTNYYIGDGDNYPFNGSIDEVRIYDRTLSPEEIAFLYNYSDVHDPIYISGDAGFAAFAQSEHIAGNGSAANPYEISGYYIVGTTSYPFSIYNSKVHFVIDQCYVQSGSRGVYLSSVENATISSNIIEKCGDDMSGIYMANTIKNSVIVGNVIRNNTGYGLDVAASIYNITIRNNSFFNDSMFFYGDYLENINITGNTVNGKPIYFYHDVDGNNLTVPSDAGEVIFVNASHIIVDGASFAMEEVSIEILSSDNITVRNVTFSDIQWYSIYTYGYTREVKDVLIENVDSVNSSVPLEIYYWSSNIYLRNSTFTGYAYIGIDEYGSVNSVVVENNTFMDISNGNNNVIYIGGGDHITVKNNIFENITTNDYAVIYADDDVEGVYNLRVENNTVKNCAIGSAIELYSDDTNTVVNNNTAENINSTATYGVICVATVKQLIGNVVKNVSITGIDVYGSNAEISNNFVRNATGHGMYIEGSGSVVHNNTVILCGGYGIYADQYSSGNLIYENYLMRNNGSADRYSAAHIQARDDGTGNQWNTSSIGNYWYDWASNNDTNDLNYDGIVDWPYSIVGGVRDEYPISNFRGAIRINSDSDFTPDNGVVGGKGTQDDPYLIMNWIIDAHRGPNAIYIGNTTKYFHVEHCELYNTTYVSLPYYYGSAITLYNVTNGYIGYNDIHDTDTYGVFMNNTHSVVLEHNLIHNNYGYGSVWLRYSTDVTFVGNEIINNYQGIYFTSSSNNTLWDNYFRGNTGSAICIYTGSGNIIYGNYFYFNDGSNGTYNSSHIQAADYSGSNYWNSSTTGNYWYDWAYNNDTNDQNRDGIVDWPYIIAGGTGVVDNYPLSRFRGVIRINGDYDFNPDNGVIAGTGTRDDPYLISGWCIDANGAGSGIYIGNVTSYFVVDGVFLNNTNYSSYPYYTGAGITLYNSSAGEIRNITSENNEMVGVMVANSEWIYLHNSTLTSNIYGLYLESSNNITVSGVVINKNKYGVYAEESNYNVFEYDNINNNTDYGLTIATGTYNEISSSDIWGNGGEGVVISGGSENRIVYTKVHDNGDTGIKILSSKNDLILETEIYSNSENGTYLSSSNNINITGAEIYSNNRNGVYIYDSYSNIVRESNITYNGANGVYVEYYSYNNTIIGNNISFNLQNVYVNGCTQTYIYSNEMWLWGNTANIYFDQALHSVIYNNTLGRGHMV